MKLALKAQQLTVSYGATNALWNADACVPAQSMTGIIGPNGAGKSTLLKALLGTVPLLSGRVELAEELNGSPTSIAYVPQRNTVDWDFPTTVFDLVMMGTLAGSNGSSGPGAKNAKTLWKHSSWSRWRTLPTAKSENSPAVSNNAPSSRGRSSKRRTST